MTREELIEEAAAAIFDAADLQLAPDDQMWELARRDARAAFAVFEKAQAPTDEREALSNFLFSVYEHGSQPNALREADAILSFLASIRPAQTEPTEAQAPTDEERHWSDAAASAYPGDEYDNADLRTAFGRGVKWERRRPAQAEPTDAQVREERS